MPKLPAPISFEWDKGNTDKNWKKHKVSVKEIEEVFFNREVRIYPDIKHLKLESRYLALGITNRNRRLTIIFIVRKEKIRVISARNQSKKERRLFNENQAT